ncbi:MAG: hypothetical protein RLZZ241_429 [Bacteroidota bacterium]|jgi:CubicO group peptidase (beta-lactamase class C family)
MESVQRPIKEGYMPAQFNEDQRAEKIKGIASELFNLMEAHATRRNIPGVAYGIVVDDTLILADAIGVIDLNTKQKATSTSAFRIASMTKSFTAMAILKLRDEGKLSLSDPAEKYVTEMRNIEYLTSDSPGITIENLLTMTAGFPEDNPWGDRQLSEPDSMLTGMISAGVSLSNPASLQYEYSNTGFALLGHIITQVSQQPYQEYITSQILNPLGMKHTYWEYDSIPKDQFAQGYRWEEEQWKPEPLLHDGSFGAMGGLITTIADFSHYVSYHLSAWPPRSAPEHGPVKRSTLREMHLPRYPRLNSQGRDWNGEACAIMAGYGYGLGSTTFCNGLRYVSHGGALPGYGSNYVFFPDYGIGLMAFGNLTYTSPWPLQEIGKLLFEKLELEPRMLPVSDILKIRHPQVAEWIQNGNPNLEVAIMAENFFLDYSRSRRRKEINEVLEKAGGIISVGKIIPENQLRASFTMDATNGTIQVFFTLTPEKEPKVQQLDLAFTAY